LAFTGILLLRSQKDSGEEYIDYKQFYTYKKPELEALWGGKKIPIETFIEAYFIGDIDINEGVDLHEMLRNHRKQLFKICFTKNHVEFFLRKFLLQAIMHNKAWDFEDVATTYNLGNDFYNAFLGESMVYTSGVFSDHEGSESLEQAQVNKMNIVAKKISMKPGDKHLDIGCGWGTFVLHCAHKFHTDSFGITIAKEQVSYAQDSIKKIG